MGVLRGWAFFMSEVPLYVSAWTRRPAPFWSRVWGLGCGVWAVGFRVYRIGSKVEGVVGFRVKGLRFGV